MSVDPPQADADLDSWRERVRRLPGVIVFRPQPPTPFVPDVQVINVKHVDELIGDDDDSYGEQDGNS